MVATTIHLPVGMVAAIIITTTIIVQLPRPFITARLSVLVPRRIIRATAPDQACITPGTNSEQRG